LIVTAAMESPISPLFQVNFQVTLRGQSQGVVR
jgi:hypothetical protein